MVDVRDLERIDVSGLGGDPVIDGLGNVFGKIQEAEAVAGLELHLLLKPPHPHHLTPAAGTDRGIRYLEDDGESLARRSGVDG